MHYEHSNLLSFSQKISIFLLCCLQRTSGLGVVLMKFMRESFMGNVSTEGAELGLAHVKQITVWSNKRDSMHW